MLKASKVREETSPRPSLRHEALAIISIALALFLFASLVSYQADDPSFGQYNTSASRNLAGKTGSYLAAFLLDGFGIASFWLPVLSLIVAFRLLRGTTIKEMVSLAASGLFLMAVTGGLLAMALGSDRIDIFSRLYPTGGISGRVSAGFLTSRFSYFGAYLIIISSFLIALMASFGFSVYLLWKQAGAKFGGLKSRLATAAGREKKASSQHEDVSTMPVITEAPQSVPSRGLDLPVASEKLSIFKVPHNFNLPPLSLLVSPVKEEREKNKESLLENAKLLENKLADFGVYGKVTEICPGPVITMYEFEPAAGVKINKITSLADDLALALKAGNIRVVVPIPGKAVIGIEIPNTYRESVYLREILGSSVFSAAPSKLTIALGKDIVGQPVVAGLAKMPHLLIAGATGTGKSVFLNAVICSILFKATPDEVRFLMIDPKRIELSAYDDIPHLLHPVVTEPKKATKALRWAVEEMERRYILLEEKKARNIDGYNQNADNPLPFILVVIDELADLMLVSSHEVEEYITRLAQMARAAGIHLLIATQRPSVDVLTGVIKANFPTRISFQVSSKTDSRTILDTGGADSLLGAGDMLFLPPGTAKLQRIQGAYVSENEIMRVVEFLKCQKQPVYDEKIFDVDEMAAEDDNIPEQDEKYEEAVKLVLNTGQASISMIQRRLRVGYNRAARMIEKMESDGLVGPADGSKPREILRRMG